MLTVIRKLSIDLSLFSFFKFITLIAPLYAASVVNSDDYGFLEFALSTAYLGALLLLFGSTRAISFGILKQEDSAVFSAMVYIISISFLLAIVFLVLRFMNWGGYSYYLAFSFVIVFVLQQALGSFFRSKAMGRVASLNDSTIYLALMLAVYLVSVDFIGFDEALWIFFWVFVFQFFFFIKIFKSECFNQCRFEFSFSENLSIITGVFLSIAVLHVPKILGYFISPQLVAEFSLLFRYLAIAVIFQQFITVFFFKDIYKTKHEIFSKFIIIIPSAVFIGAACMYGLFNGFSYYFISLGLALPKFEPSLAIMMVSCIALWSLTSLLDGFFLRERKYKINIVTNLLGLLTFLLLLGVLFINNHNPSVTELVQYWLISYAVISASQVVLAGGLNGFDVKNIVMFLIFIGALNMLMNIWFQ